MVGLMHIAIRISDLTLKHNKMSTNTKHYTMCTYYEYNAQAGWLLTKHKPRNKHEKNAPP